MVKFVVLTTQRSGFTWVIEMLNSHPCVVTYSELFLETSKERPVWGGLKTFCFIMLIFEVTGVIL